MTRKLVQPFRHPITWVFLLALGTRLANLTYHSLWFDEAMSAFWASKPAGEIWRVGLDLTADKHPPLYYLLLRAWTLLFGGGDVALRSLGAIIGALAVFPAYGIGRRLGNETSGILGALLLALNPFLVWYSQEARMFMPATSFLLVGLYGLLVIGDLAGSPGEEASRGASALRKSRAWVGALAVVGGFLAALYSYLYSAFLLPVAGLWLLLLRWRNQGRPAANRAFWLGTAALATTVLLFIPLARSAWQVSGAEAVPGEPFVGLLPSLARLFKVYALGWPGWEQPVILASTAILGLLLVLGWIAPSPHRLGGTFLISWMAVVVLVGGYLLGRDSQVFAETRYQIALVPALCLAWGRGLAWLWDYRRWAGLAAMALVVAITAAALGFDWAPENRREDWREAAAFVESHAGPNDAVLIHADYLHVAFERYFSGPQPVFFPITDQVTDPDAVDQVLLGLQSFDSVWVVRSHHEQLDPDNLILGWFGARYPLISEVFPTGIALHGFAQHYRLAELPEAVPALPEQPELEGIRILSCALEPDRLAAQDDRLHPPSGWIHATTYWTLVGTAQANDVQPVVRMVDELGQVWGESLARPNDAFQVWPASRWVPGEVLRADHDVNLNPVTPEGTYQVVVEIPGVQEKGRCGQVEITG